MSRSALRALEVAKPLARRCAPRTLSRNFTAASNDVIRVRYTDTGALKQAPSGVLVDS